MMMFSVMLFAALQAEPRMRPSPGVSESPAGRAPISSLDGGPPEGAGARGPSGEQRYDAVGFAGISEQAGDPQAISVSTDAVGQGSFVELTALDSGRTIVALVNGHGTGGGVVGLSPGAAQLLGLQGGSAAVRVRGVTPTPQDQVALRGGHSASARLDAPAALLTALRKRLPAGGPAPARAIQRQQPVTRPATRPGAAYAPPRNAAPVDEPAPTAEPVRRAAPFYTPPPAAPAPAAGWYVQVAALSSLARAQALAASLGGGRVVSSGGIHRVQIGPYGDAGSAAQARDDAARRGYGGARVVHD